MWSPPWAGEIVEVYSTVETAPSGLSLMYRDGTLVVGARLHDIDGSENVGAAYVFYKDAPLPAVVPSSAGMMAVM